MSPVPTQECHRRYPLMDPPPPRPPPAGFSSSLVPSNNSAASSGAEMPPATPVMPWSSANRWKVCANSRTPVNPSSRYAGGGGTRHQEPSLNPSKTSNFGAGGVRPPPVLLTGYGYLVELPQRLTRLLSRHEIPQPNGTKRDDTEVDGVQVGPSTFKDVEPGGGEKHQDP